MDGLLTTCVAHLNVIGRQFCDYAGGMLLQGLRLFDVYRGGQIGAGKKSLAYAVTYQAEDRTLTDADVAAVRARIVKRLEDELGAQLRA